VEAAEASREFDDKGEIKRVWVCVTETKQKTHCLGIGDKDKRQ